MSEIIHIHNHIAFVCECGSVHFHLLKSGSIECAGCQFIQPHTWETPTAWEVKHHEEMAVANEIAELQLERDRLTASLAEARGELAQARQAHIDQCTVLQKELELCIAADTAQMDRTIASEKELEEAKESARVWEDRFRKRGYVMEEHAQALKERDELKGKVEYLEAELLDSQIHNTKLIKERDELREECAKYRNALLGRGCHDVFCDEASRKCEECPVRDHWKKTGQGEGNEQ